MEVHRTSLCPCEELVKKLSYLYLVRFYIKLRENKNVIESSIGYLDCLDAPATDMSTIYYLLCRSLRIKEQLDLCSLVYMTRQYLLKPLK